MTPLEKFLTTCESRLEKGAPRADGDASFPNKAFRADLAKLLATVKVMTQDLKSVANIDQGKLRHLAEASIEQANAIAGEGEK